MKTSPTRRKSVDQRVEFAWWLANRHPRGKALRIPARFKRLVELMERSQRRDDTERMLASEND